MMSMPKTLNLSPKPVQVTTYAALIIFSGQDQFMLTGIAEVRRAAGGSLVFVGAGAGALHFYVKDYWFMLYPWSGA